MDLERSQLCLTCHESRGSRWSLADYEVSSSVCEYGAEWELEKAERIRQQEILRLAAERDFIIRAIESFLGLAVEEPAAESGQEEEPLPEGLPDGD